MLREWIKENTKSDGTTIIVNENISIIPPRTFDGMTNLQEVVLPKNLKKIGLYGYFDKIICAPMVEHGKPAPDVYEFACSELKLAPEECMAVEDSPNGVKSAYSAGCKVVMVPDLTQPDEELKKMLFACVDRIDEIKSIV